MKADWSGIESFRQDKGPNATQRGDRFGAFYFSSGKSQIIVIASEGDEEYPWQHVSLRARDYKGERTPTWQEMCFIKDMFWDEEECVVQYHPPKSDYVNNHPHVLHLWKPTGIEIPRPPSILVGIK